MEYPNQNCYWVKVGQLLAGEYPRDQDLKTSQQKLQKYLHTGVSFFVDLTQEGELSRYDDLLPEFALNGLPVEYVRFAIPDKSVPRNKLLMLAILDSIHHAIGQGHCVYVHCWGGVGRTGTVVGCYLVEGGMSGQDALIHLQQLWSSVDKIHRHPASPETQEQRQWVLDWSSNQAMHEGT
ncbi:protein-tyrosine phosphatase family protein [Janthinobacterium sp. B9-8]|uniref:protein-tyrosine phosphatase family protein n=1 Tax=Janthinobacterium sp. B9-8 TaxID=1236179 RepID=UPI00061D3600|nr:protein-tyrosine phosphatase family protein [Janthinobacterium sp. B9-8]AMC35278.1 hypothetical protein VN23_11995 [Janthinobacterium sp. B9-8]